MCTGFIHRGRDTVFGFNMDLGDGIWPYKVYTEPDGFYVGVMGQDQLYRIHGVNGNGQFANLPYMNAPELGQYAEGPDHYRIDQLVSDYIRGETTYSDVLNLVRTKKIVNLPNLSMHSLIGDADGHVLLVETGLGGKELTEKNAVISNFSLLQDPLEIRDEIRGWYGFDRYETVRSMLEEAGDDLSLSDGLKILKAAQQTQYAPTRVSFVYSVNRHTVEYVLEREWDQPQTYELVPLKKNHTEA